MRSSPPHRRTLRGADGNHLVGDVVGDPSGPTALLLHGGGQTRHAWAGTASALADRGWQVCALDQRGHGDSDRAPSGQYSIDHFARDVAAAAPQVGTPTVLVGASLGGIAALLAVAESGDQAALARGLVLVDVAHRSAAAGRERVVAFMSAHPDGFATLEEAAEAVTAYNPHRPRPEGVTGLEKNLRRRDDGRWVWHWDPAFISHGVDDRGAKVAEMEARRLPAAARSLTVPTLLVRGGDSDLLTPELAQEFLDLVPGAEMVSVDRAGHMVAGDRNDAFTEAIAPFMDRLEAMRRAPR